MRQTQTSHADVTHRRHTQASHTDVTWILWRPVLKPRSVGLWFRHSQCIKQRRYILTSHIDINLGSVVPCSQTSMRRCVAPSQAVCHIALGSVRLKQVCCAQTSHCELTRSQCRDIQTSHWVLIFFCFWVCLLVGCLTSQQHASISQGQICSDSFTCCHIETEVADQTFYLTQSQYTDTGPTSPGTDPIVPCAWRGSHWSASF